MVVNRSSDWHPFSFSHISKRAQFQKGRKTLDQEQIITFPKRLVSQHNADQHSHQGRYPKRISAFFMEEGSIAMSCYFFRGTALEELEREMMTIPGFDHRPRSRHPGSECRVCVNYRPRVPCMLHSCPYLAERMASGELTATSLVRKLYQPFPHISARLDRHPLPGGPFFFRHEIHRQRWWRWRNRFSEMSDQQKAVLYLLTSYEPVWAATIWHMSRDGFDFHNVSLGSLTMEQYAVYQAAKAIVTGSRNITARDLVDRSLISDEAFRLITGALLIAVFGDIILSTN